MSYCVCGGYLGNPFTIIDTYSIRWCKCNNPREAEHTLIPSMFTLPTHKVYLCFEDGDNYSISTEYIFNTKSEAQAFCDGLNVGLDKGRCDFHRAFLNDDPLIQNKLGK